MRPLTAVVAVVLLLAALAVSLCHAMANYDHNENMYVTAGVMISRGDSVYHDFAYLQTPYLPELYGAIFHVTGTQHHVLLARIVNWLLWSAGAGLVGWVASRLTTDRLIATALALLYLLNQAMLRITIESSNYVLPATLALAQAALVLAAMNATRPSRNRVLLFLGGLAAGCAVGTKLNFLAAVVPFFVAPLLGADQGDRRARVGGLLAMIAGFGLALVPAILLLARDPWVFVFDNLRFHALVTRKDWASPMASEMTFKAKLSWVKHHYAPNAIAIVLVMLGAAALALVPRFRSAVSRDRLAFTLAAAGALACTVAAALYMTPIWPQYFAMPVPYVLLLAACLASSWPSGRVCWGIALGCCVAVWACFAVNRNDLGSLGDIQAKWTPLAIEHSAAQIRRQLETAGLAGKLATLQPLFATEAGLPFYREFATGPFLFGIGDLLSEPDRKRLIGTSPSALSALFDADPPAAILVGLYSGWTTEKPLEAYALSHGYRPVRLDYVTFPAMTAHGDSSESIAPLYGGPRGVRKEGYAILYMRRSN